MRPINHKERNNLFWQFVLLFAAAVAVVVLALHFDFTLPETLSEAERERYKSLKNFGNNQNAIKQQIEEINSQIGRLEESQLLTDDEIAASTSIAKMVEFAGSDTTQRSFLDKVASALKNYKQSQMRIINFKREQTDAKIKIERAAEMIKTLKQELNDARGYPTGTSN